MYTDKEKLRWLWGRTKGYHLLYFMSLIGIMICGVMQLTVAVFTQNIVDRFLTGSNAKLNMQQHQNVFIMLILGMVLLTFLRSVIEYAACMGTEKVSQHVLNSVRDDLFYKVQHQDMRFYDQYRTGDLMTRLTGDLDAIRHMLAWVIRSICDCFSLYMSSMIYFLYLDLEVAVAIFVFTPIIFAVILRFKNKIGPLHGALREQLSQLNTAAQENISGNRVVKAFAREDYEIQRFDERNKAYLEANKKTILTWIKYFPIIEGCANMLPVVLIVFGGMKMIDGTLTGGEYIAFASLIWAVTVPMRMLGNVLNEFQRFSAACNKVMELEASEPSIVDQENAIDHPQRFDGKIEFRNVSFSYGKKKVLEDINFVVEPGQTVAIMGETGSGKTSLINLLPRFYDPDSGNVLIDGMDVKDLKSKQLRKNIGMATQDILLYSDTIDGNIAFGDSAMSEEKVKKYAKDAAADEFIEKLPLGYDTIIGERGVGLSGGQKQRISLARALAIEPSILVLDDTTSAVDMETEHYIQEQLKQLEFPCTKLIIAQRISSTKDADMILILKDGKIVERGTHQELVAQEGYYYDIYQLQGGGESIG
ncbi:MAG: ABC transporter ATP-binding protein [Eubacteriales bacterium]|nr:ABC transporter ATP-binding protein [Eubacteriales bacterium]